MITDGAKRDREIWPGDMSVAVPSIFVSTNDLQSVQNSLNSLLSLQNATTGMLPYAGIPFSDLGIVSFTYHLYSLIGISYYYQYTGDVAYLRSLWPVFTKGTLPTTYFDLSLEFYTNEINRSWLVPRIYRLLRIDECHGICRLVACRDGVSRPHSRVRIT